MYFCLGVNKVLVLVLVLCDNVKTINNTSRVPVLCIASRRSHNKINNRIFKRYSVFSKNKQLIPNAKPYWLTCRTKNCQCSSLIRDLGSIYDHVYIGVRDGGLGGAVDHPKFGQIHLFEQKTTHLFD